jgi:hypothetical protein
VLSTLHTDDAPSCVTRLTDIGIEPYVSASALIGVIAQRLVRRLCSECKRPYTPEPETLRAMSITDAEASTLTFYRAIGCDRCNHTGYKGRVGIYEVMAVTNELRKHITQRGAEAELRQTALATGMISLGEDGLLKVKAGVTTPQELLRVVTEVREKRAACPKCATPVSPEFAACPNCGQPIGNRCPTCNRILQAEWKFCPYCPKGTALAPPKRASRRVTSRKLPELPAASNVAEFKK